MWPNVIKLFRTATNVFHIQIVGHYCFDQLDKNLVVYNFSYYVQFKKKKSNLLFNINKQW